MTRRKCPHCGDPLKPGSCTALAVSGNRLLKRRIRDALALLKRALALGNGTGWKMYAFADRGPRLVYEAHEMLAGNRLTKQKSEASRATGRAAAPATRRRKRTAPRR